MKLWTIQPLSVYNELKQNGIFRCDSSKSELLKEEEFQHAYKWMVEQMEKCIVDVSF